MVGLNGTPPRKRFDITVYRVVSKALPCSGTPSALYCNTSSQLWKDDSSKRQHVSGLEPLPISCKVTQPLPLTYCREASLHELIDSHRH